MKFTILASFVFITACAPWQEVSISNQKSKRVKKMSYDEISERVNFLASEIKKYVQEHGDLPKNLSFVPADLLLLYQGEMSFPCTICFIGKGRVKDVSADDCYIIAFTSSPIFTDKNKLNGRLAIDSNCRVQLIGEQRFNELLNENLTQIDYKG